MDGYFEMELTRPGDDIFRANKVERGKAETPGSCDTSLYRCQLYPGDGSRGYFGNNITNRPHWSLTRRPRGEQNSKTGTAELRKFRFDETRERWQLIGQLTRKQRGMDSSLGRRRKE
ncbi:uncharacterized protein LOC122527990 [Frieseomelitta varia]|uniref:uncharacterized protein LOC122527990 n=1 Tax=Frieseomelitta varia TaxID=561572 RepID=UPI001CB6A64A|nr:uncharacterized protein LOC122527990 [Frieseomelitta varia]